MQTGERIRRAWRVLVDSEPNAVDVLSRALRSANPEPLTGGPVRAKQDSSSAFSLDPFVSDADVKAGFRRITSGNVSWNRDLSPLTQDKMIELAWYLYRRNPLATRLIDLTKVYVMGEGMTVACEDQTVQDWIDAFWGDPVNQLDLLLPEYVRDLGLFGEQLYLTSENPIDGSMRLWYIDPSEIYQVVYGGAAADVPGANRSIAIPIEITLKMKLGESEAPRLSPFRPEEDPDSAGFGRSSGNCFYFAVNRAGRGTRGCSDIFGVADWLDGYEQFLFAGLDRVELQNNFVWDVMLKGQTQEQIDEWLKKHGRAPRPGSVRAHNENVTWASVAPQFGSADMGATGRQFKNHILGSKGFPEHWFGEGGNTNLATAEAQGSPTTKTLRERQMYVIHMVTTICNVVIDRGIAHGSLARTVARDFTVDAPQIEIKDTTRLATAVGGIATALSLAQQEGWIRKETATRIFAGVVTQLGPEVDADAEIKAQSEQLGPSEEDYAGGSKMPGADKAGTGPEADTLPPAGGSPAPGGGKGLVQ